MLSGILTERGGLPTSEVLVGVLATFFGWSFSIAHLLEVIIQLQIIIKRVS